MNADTARVQARLNRVNEADASGSVSYRDLGAEWKASRLAEIDARDWSGQDDVMTTIAGSKFPMAQSAKQTAIHALDADNPYKDQWLKETTLSSQQQAIYDAQQRAQLTGSAAAADAASRLKDVVGTQVNTDGLQGWQGVSADGLPAMRDLDYSGIHGPEWLTRDGMQGVRGSVGASDFSADRQRVEEAMLARLAPQRERDRAAFDAKMAAQGVSQGSQAYGAGADELNRATNDARLGAVLAGGQEQSRLFGLELQQGQFENASQAQEFAQRGVLADQHNGIRQNAIAEQVQAAGFQNQLRQQALAERTGLANFGNDLRQQQLAERLQLRSQPINEVAALFGLGGQVQTPGGRVAGGGSGGGVQVGSPDLQGAVQGAYNTRSGQVASNNAASAQTTGSAVAAAATVAAAVI